MIELKNNEKNNAKFVEIERRNFYKPASLTIE